MSDSAVLPAGRELDILIDSVVMGRSPGDWQPICYVEGHSLDEYVWCYTCNRACSEVAKVPRLYSTDITAAWAIVNHLGARGYWFQIEQCERGWSVTVEKMNDVIAGDGYVMGDHEADETAPLAICKAALKAVSALRA